MDWESFAYGAVSVFIVILLMATFGFAHVGNSISTENFEGTSSNMPEKCKVPAGQDLGSWLEHLGHHAETQECLKYFD